MNTLLPEQCPEGEAGYVVLPDTTALEHKLGHIVVEDLAPEVETKEIPGMPRGFYNAAAWANGAQTLLLGRHVNAPGAPDEGDPGPIILIVLEDDKVVSNTDLWHPEQPDKYGDQLEDARVIVTTEGDVTVGCTRLTFNLINHRYEPFPAIAYTSSGALLKGDFPDTFIIEGYGQADNTTPIDEAEPTIQLISGKNATPLGQSPEHKRFMFRKESHNHTLTVVSLDEKNKAELLQNLDFPKDKIPWWGKNRMGTTMPPIWLNETEALFLIHGFRLLDGKPQYAIGSSRLFIGADGAYHIDNISTEPLLTPDGLSAELFPDQQLQLHPEERSAIYMCGGVVVNDKFGKPKFVYGYPSIGDSQTVESVFNIDAITRLWYRNKSIHESATLASVA